MMSYSKGGRPTSARYAAAALSAWAFLGHFAFGLVHRKEDPKEAFKKFQEAGIAEDYMEKWKDKSWEMARKSCDTDKLPATTDAVIRKICGDHVKDGDRCVCNTAKAHACHVGCKKADLACPKECARPSCYAGDPKNGGIKLNRGLHGTCYGFCSSKWGPYRYCGSSSSGKSTMYNTGLFVDCTGCDPSQGMHAKMTRKQVREEWTQCMVGCYPKPSCVKMCAEGTDECYPSCVENYRHVVDPYWDMFKGSLEAVPLIGAPKKPPEDAPPKKEMGGELDELEGDFPEGEFPEGELMLHAMPKRSNDTDDEIVRLFGIRVDRAARGRSAALAANPLSSL